MIEITDAALESIYEEIGRYPPERGGALLGPPGLDIVSTFVADRSANATQATYSSTLELNRVVRNLELSESLEFKGIVHSHPGQFDRPSGQDMAEFTKSLRINRHLGHVVAIIVNRHNGPTGSHQIRHREMVVTAFVVWRTSKGTPNAESLKVLSPSTDLQTLATEFQLAANSTPTIVANIDGHTLFSSSLALAEDCELSLVAGAGYPVTPPLLIEVTGADNTTEVPCHWRPSAPASTRLVEGLRATGELERMRARIAVRTPNEEHVDVEPPFLFERSGGLLSTALAEETILVVGCGSVGTYFAEQMVRAGVGHVILVDGDDVEPANLSRSIFDARDISMPKPEALRQHLEAINQNLAVEVVCSQLQDIPPEEVDQYVARVGLLAAATDDNEAQSHLNRFAYSHGVPALFMGIYERAAGGEIIVSEPPNPCYRCATAMRHAIPAEGISQRTDYTTGRLAGEVGLAADIQHVVSAGVKLGLARLSARHADAGLSSFGTRILESGSTYLTLSTEPDFWFYPTLFEELPGQYAYQSVWLRPTRDGQCGVCGDEEYRIRPLAVPLKTPGTADLRRVFVDQVGALTKDTEKSEASNRLS